MEINCRTIDYYAICDICIVTSVPTDLEVTRAVLLSGLRGILLKLQLFENVKHSFYIMWVRPSVSCSDQVIYYKSAEKGADPLSTIFSPVHELTHH